jgi:demethylmenaquinone methyltransferase/2-methoxy-6-polyprenyl-1,4-benzoquinol methylase
MSRGAGAPERRTVRQEAHPRTAEFFAPGQKARFVRSVFDTIAPRYDLLNSVTSFGLHRRWREAALRLTGLRPGDAALDVACGTGEFLFGLRRLVGPGGTVVGLDFSRGMLGRASQRLQKSGVRAALVLGDAERMPFRSECFQAVTTGFALRNFSDLEAFFREGWRVLARGGRLVALEIAGPEWWPYRPLFLWYFEKALPRLAALLKGERQAYRWLPASLAAFHTREEVTRLMRQAGFTDIAIRNLAGGAVCVYTGTKP